MHTAHWYFKAAWLTSGRNPCWRRMALNLSGLGCPKFWWLRIITCFSSSGKFWKLWCCCGFGLGLLMNGSWVLGELDWLGDWLSGNTGDGAAGWSSSGFDSGGTLTESSDSLGASAGTGGLAANTVILIRHSCDGRINWRCESFSHSSHSSSTKILVVPLLRYTRLRKGAIPWTRSLGGPMVRLVPRHAMTVCTFLLGRRSWITCLMSSSWIVRLPTLGTWLSTWSNTWFQASRMVIGVCLPFSFRRFITACETTSDDLAGFGLAATVKRLRLASGSAVCTNVSVFCFTGCSRGTRSLRVIFTMDRANLWGYFSVNLDLFMVCPWYFVVPSITWCSCCPLHFFIDRNWAMDSEVVITVMLFLICLPFWGSFKSPATHMSKLAGIV